MLSRSSASDASERGQILVIFAVAFAVIIMMLAVLIDGARGVVMRRQLQDASDAAALAAANVIQGLTYKGCSLTDGPPPGDPQPEVEAAAKASVATNLPGYDTDDVVVTCTDGWTNVAVEVAIGDNPPSFFGAIFGGGGLEVNTDSTAINGPVDPDPFNIVLLDPYHADWPNNVNGCPSFGINGGIVAEFESHVYVNSGCSAAEGGAFAAKGGSATLTFTGGNAPMRLHGEWKPQALTVTPTPLEHQPIRPDPLADLPVPPVSSIVVRRASKTTINGTSPGQCTSNGLVAGTNGCILEPGVYVGGIDLKSSATIFLRPGLYVLKDGGLSLGAQSSLYTVPATGTGSTGTTAATWGTACGDTNCGVLIYKTNGGTYGSERISVAAGATFLVRAFEADADTTVLTGGATLERDRYHNVLMWQSRDPEPTKTYAQPSLLLQGGGQALLSGTVYAPSAVVELGGTPGGSGGVLELTLQFISWDLTFSGNASFRFNYSALSFPHPIEYGLVE
jgi:hypothetical protein